MAKACNSLFSTYEYGFKASSHEVGKEALTFALLETVRLVLEGREAEDVGDKYGAGSPDIQEDQTISSEQTSSDFYLPIQTAAQRKKIPVQRSGVPGGPCAHCGALESPQWRRPVTKKVVLCNACGIYYSRHHSLPKRKKMPSAKQAASNEEEQESGGEENNTAAGGEYQDGFKASDMACDLPHHGSDQDCSAHHLSTHAAVHDSNYAEPEGMQCEDHKHGVMVRSATPFSASMASMSPARSFGSAVLPDSSVSALSSTPKKRTDDGLDSSISDGSLAIRAMKRAATAAMVANAAAQPTAIPVISTGNSSGVASPASDSFLISRRPAVTTTLGSSLLVSREHSRMSVIMAALMQQSRHAPASGPNVYAVSNFPGMLTAGELN